MKEPVVSQQLSFHADEQLSENELNAFLQQTDYPTVWNLPFLESQASPAHRPVLFRVQRGSTLVALALGMFNRRFLRSHLLLPTYPRILPPANAATKACFWKGIEDYCRHYSLVRVSVNSYEAPAPDAPTLTDITWSKPRSEYYLDLTPELDAILASFSSSHRRNIKKARKHELLCSIKQSDASLGEHLAAFSHTAARRETRKESIPGVNKQLLRTLLESKSAFLMQLHQEEKIVSSMFIITTDKSAFYFSGGTTSEGTKMGAFHYLIWLAIAELKERGITTMTLGGTDAETPEGLRRFKLGFNAREVPLVHYEYLEGVAPLKFCSRLLAKVRR